MEKRSKQDIRIVVIGPESTGKTTLCEELALHYNCRWIPEYARKYIEEMKRPYNNEDVLHIARMQMEEEDKLVENKSLIFIDTDIIITKVWLLHVYGNSPEWIDSWLKTAPRTLYLVCTPDLPWEYDPVRENPDKREYLMDWYCREIESFGFSYRFVSGTGIERTLSAIREIDPIIG